MVTPSTRLAIIGHCPVPTDELSRRFEGFADLSVLDRLAGELPGSFHLLAARDGEVRVQGAVSGLRRVFHADAGGFSVASDRADVVAALTGADVDHDRLALWLVAPAAPVPLGNQPPWRGVRGLPEDSWLRLDHDGRAGEHRWWHPPEPELPIAEGAVRLANALTESVRWHAPAGAEVGADLSGGLDSTTLCFLAARGGARISSVTYACRDSSNDDVEWAGRAAATLSSITDLYHRVLPADEIPLPFEGFWQPGEPMDAPFPGLRDAAKIAYGVRQAATPGGTNHLSGMGGDEVLVAPPSSLHTTFRGHPAIALSQLRGQQARHRVPRRKLLRAVTDRRGYREWFLDAADGLGYFGVDQYLGIPLDWDGPFKLPPWVTRDAEGTIRASMRDAAATAEPLAPSRGQHGSLLWIRRGAAIYRQVRRFVERTGRDMVLPFLDDRIMEICLSVRLHERSTPWRYKPLLVEAMRGVVPDESLARTTKGHHGSEMFLALREFRPKLAELLDDPLLAKLGFVDVDALRSACLSLYPPTVPITVLETTLACEVWLRAVTGDRAPIGKASP